MSSRGISFWGISYSMIWGKDPRNNWLYKTAYQFIFITCFKICFVICEIWSNSNYICVKYKPFSAEIECEYVCHREYVVFARIMSTYFILDSFKCVKNIVLHIVENHEIDLFRTKLCGQVNWLLVWKQKNNMIYYFTKDYLKHIFSSFTVE